MRKISDSVSLRPLAMEDAEDIFEVINSERDYLRKWLPFIDATQKPEDTINALECLLSSKNEQFGIVCDGKVVGVIGFKDTDLVTKKTEIGYWMSESMQGGGIMTTAVVCLLQYAFMTLSLNRVQIKVATKNIRSRKIPERLELKQEGIEREACLLSDNTYADLAVYSMLKREFEELIKD